MNTLFNVPNIAATLKSQIIRWAGHVWRAESPLILLITKWKPNKSRLRGRPRQQFEGLVKEDLRMLGSYEWRRTGSAQISMEGDSGSGNRSKWPRISKKKIN